MMHCGHCYDNHQSPYSGECPGIVCPDCADNREWHRVIMAEKCGEDEHHCACVPILRARIRDLEAATRRVVEALIACQDAVYFEATDLYGKWCGHGEKTPRAFQQATTALSDPIIAALGRE